MTILSECYAELDLGSTPQFETVNAQDTHGQGEDAVALLRMICPECNHVEPSLIGVNCLKLISAVQVIDLEHPCQRCGCMLRVRSFILASI